MDPFTALLIAGAMGAAMGIFQGYQTNKAAKMQQKSAQQQLELAKKQALEEEQARNKADQKEVDIEGLLSEYSSANVGTNLTGARGLERNTNPLSKKSALLGGGYKK